MSLGKLIAEYRLARGWSYRQLASRAHVSPTTIVNIEKGHNDDLRFFTALRIARALGCPLELIAVDDTKGGPS